MIRRLYSNLNTFYNNYHGGYALVNPLFNISADGSSLTWYNYTSKEVFYTYEDYFQWVADNLQYSLAIDDKVLLQVFYQSIQGVITKASLSFLPNPNLPMTCFRFDMDTKNGKSYYHNSYHINFGYNSDDLRFTLHKFPYPSEFLKFCLFLLSNPEFNSFNSQKFFIDLDEIGEEYSHRFDFTLQQ